MQDAYQAFGQFCMQPLLRVISLCHLLCICFHPAPVCHSPVSTYPCILLYSWLGVVWVLTYHDSFLYVVGTCDLHRDLEGDWSCLPLTILYPPVTGRLLIWVRICLGDICPHGCSMLFLCYQL